MAPPRKSLPAAPTTICALGDDLLREIFLRLPSLPTLVRAALTCHSFLRAVRSSPVFRRRFRELHSPPLLGLFLGIFESDDFAFRPLRLRSNPDLAAVVRGADFFLTRLPDDDDDDEGIAPKWLIRDCHDGYVLLTSMNTEHMAVYNPLTRALELFPQPPAEICEEMCVEYFVISSEEDHGTFRVISVCHQAHGAQALVLSSETRKWQIFPLVDAASTQPGDEYSCEYKGNLVNGFIYLTQPNQASARALNTSTLQFSRIDLPPQVEDQTAFTFGQTMDGKLCVACIVEHSLAVWFRGNGDDGSQRWMLEKIFPLGRKIYDLVGHSMGDAVLHIVGIENGFVYLSTYFEEDAKLSGWFLSFCLQTAKLNKLSSILHAENMYPYIMAWPPSLVLLNKANLDSKVVDRPAAPVKSRRVPAST